MSRDDACIASAQGGHPCDRATTALKIGQAVAQASRRIDAACLPGSDHTLEKVIGMNTRTTGVVRSAGPSRGRENVSKEVGGLTHGRRSAKVGVYRAYRHLLLIASTTPPSPPSRELVCGSVA